ncbi:hypothetical protein DID75_04685 [Candidatus Marinamargulisbacteria bacterium SCGC AG-410-N11]|nr:hypothetical protein DID75_04685 [Candidatus Marinamargulisbacteria bacterium SCGC AG-410-N11]
MFLNVFKHIPKVSRQVSTKKYPPIHSFLSQSTQTYSRLTANRIKNLNYSPTLRPLLSHSNLMNAHNGVFDLTRSFSSVPNRPRGLVADTPDKDACGTGIYWKRSGDSTRLVVNQVLNMVKGMEHRGAVGIDHKTGDGAGVLFYGADQFFSHVFKQELTPGDYAVCSVYLHDTDFVSLEVSGSSPFMAYLNTILNKEGLTSDDVRKVPINESFLGYIARENNVSPYQVLIKKPDDLSQQDFEKKLVLARTKIDNHFRDTVTPNSIVSMSSYYVGYKALTVEHDYPDFFLDFKDEQFMAYAAVPHTRFSTNTLSTFENVQPFAKLANNGECNNIEQVIRFLKYDPIVKSVFGEQLSVDGCSDSNVMSKYMDVLHLLGFGIEDIVYSTIQPIDVDGSHYRSQYFNLFGMPFEGPNASIVMQDDQIVICRDKNGFRPQRGFIDDDTFFSGSEIGPCRFSGRPFDLGPAEPLLLDLQSGDVRSLKQDQDSFFELQMNQLSRLDLNNIPLQPITFDAEVLELKKLQAGWNKEVDDHFMQPLYHDGAGMLLSMGDQGPIESLVSGSFNDIGNYFKAKFSQVTNPALAKREERAYMSTKTFIGKKPEFKDLKKELVSGLLLDTPILSNQDMVALQQSKDVTCRVIDMGISVLDIEDHAKQRIQDIIQDAVDQVKKGSSVLILSDLKLDKDEIPLSPVLVSSMLNDALIEQGLRRQVSIVLETSQLLKGRDMAQAISIGGCDAVNPYLAYINDPKWELSDREFLEKAQSYTRMVTEDVLGFMARMGISTMSAYRGIKGFTAYGIDDELAQLFGVNDLVGGLSFHELITISKTNFVLPLKEGIGKYNWQGQESRTKIWGAGITNLLIKSVRQDDADAFLDMERKVELLRKGQPRGWFRLRSPQTWNDKTPLPVCILGGGAAGFYQAQSLLELPFKMKIDIIERKHVNNFGLVGDGIAPDHESTKRQALVLRDILEDPENNVSYYGGIEIGQRVKIGDLRKMYPCIIDCRGASKDRQLGIDGEHLPNVISASQVYTAYNGEFDPFNKNDWPLNTKGKNAYLGVIGSGNVAADLARIFMKDPDELEDTAINPAFLDCLRREGPSITNIFYYGHPYNSKIGLKELGELDQLDGVQLSSIYDESLFIDDTLSSDQQQILNFFSKIKDNVSLTADDKRINFYFQLSPQRFETSSRNVAAYFEHMNGQELLFRAKNFITAIGKEPEHDDNELTYKSGWAVGEGGTLKLARDSAETTANQIKEDYYSGQFHLKPGVPYEFPWQLRSSVNKDDFLNIQDYITDGHSLRTVADFRKARHYRRVEPVIEQSVSLEAIPVSEPVSTGVSAMPDRVILVQDGETFDLGTSEQSILDKSKELKSDLIEHECDGELTCGTCAIELVDGDKKVDNPKLNKAILKANNFDPSRHVLSCDHTVKSQLGTVWKVPSRSYGTFFGGNN